MKVETFELPVTPLKGDYEAPSVTALESQSDGSLLCGVAFASPAVMRLRVTDAGLSPKDAEDLKVEESLGADVLGVTNGLRPSTSGDTAFALFHKGMLPGVFSGLLGKGLSGKRGKALVDFLLEQDGGMGTALRHSVVQLSENKLVVRHFKNPGMLWDVAHIGDFVYGLHSTSVWREPYLNVEKRETLRGDLGANFSFHRDDAGNFWFVGQNMRLMRMAQGDNKAKPTPLKFADNSGFSVSATSTVDGWLYGTSGHSKTLVRIRINPVSFEEESQKICDFSQPITGLCAVDHPEVHKLVIAVEGREGAEIHALDLIRPEDPEMLPPVPVVRSLGRCEGVNCVSKLTLLPLPKVEAPEIDSDPSSEIRKPANAGPPPVIWAGEGRLGWGVEDARKPRLLRISGF